MKGVRQTKNVWHTKIMGVLKIPQIPQYGVLVEETYGKDDSLFHDVYKGAVKNVFDIIIGQQKNTNEHCSNPCIAFVGKRGTGKSSAMISFSNYLQNISSSNSEWIHDESIQETINKASYHVLSPIDTANMSNNETIVANVSATMYSTFNLLKESIPVEQKRTFLELAQKTNNSAILKNFGNMSELGDQLLAETDNVVNIKNTFEELVQKFLEIVGKKSNKDIHYLVIQIDDLDMNVSNSFVIMEEIRNILSVKNVIILLSVDIKQFKSIFKVHFESSLNKSLKSNEDTQRTSADLSYKYIEKLLPADRRHYMPELTTEQLLQLRSQNFLGDGDKNWGALGLHDISEKNSSPTVMNAFMHLIWRKTMMIPMKNEYGDYILLPHNLRSLCNFIVFLRNMKDAAYAPNSLTPLTYFDYADKEHGENYRTILEYNLRLLNKYIVSNLETCERPEMNTEDQKLTNILLVLIETLSDAYVSEINSKLVGDILRGIREINSNYYWEWFDNDNMINSLLSATRYKDTVSMGDVLYVLGKIDKKTHCNYIRYLIEVIRTLWSIKMTFEIYITGCNPENEKHCEPKAKFITRYFRDTVGAMIINPDKTEVFYWDKKKAKNDWSICESRSKQNLKMYDLIISHNEESIIKFYPDKTYAIEKWRIHLLSGEPVYRGHYEENQNLRISHPMALFSNLLYPHLIESSSQDSSKKFSRWQKVFIMALPFYSMGYMSRLYDEYIKQIRTIPFANSTSIMFYVLERVFYATKKLWEEIKYYIPYIAPPNKNQMYELPFYNNEISINNKLENGHFIFDAPIEALKMLVEWDNELVLVNKLFVEKLKLAKEKLDTSQTYSDSYSNSLNELWLCIKTNLSYLIVNKEKYFPESQNYIVESKEKLNELISLLEGKKEITPFYFFDDSANVPRIKTKKNSGKKDVISDGN